jgi:hypothetical protein
MLTPASHVHHICITSHPSHYVGRPPPPPPPHTQALTKQLLSDGCASAPLEDGGDDASPDPGGEEGVQGYLAQLRVRAETLHNLDRQAHENEQSIRMSTIMSGASSTSTSTSISICAG